MPTLLNVPAVTNTGGGTSTGDTLVLTLTFDVSVNGLTSGTDNTIFLLGGSPTEASWGGTGSTRTLTFSITSGDNGAVTIDEAALKSALVAGITDGAGTAFTYTANSGNIADIIVGLTTVDTTAPIPASANTWSVSPVPTGQSTFKLDDVIDVTLTMSEALKLPTGSAALAAIKIVIAGKDFVLNTATGKTDASSLTAGKLVFSYTVVSSDNINAIDFDIDDNSDIILTGVTDIAGNAPNLDSITSTIELSTNNFAKLALTFTDTGGTTSDEDSTGIIDDFSKASSSNGWTAGVYSNQGFIGDGYVIAKIETTLDFIFGLSSSNGDTNADAVDYGIYIENTSTITDTRESGIRSVILPKIPVVKGDYLKVERTGNEIKYYLIESQYYTNGGSTGGRLVKTTTISGATVTAELHIEASFWGGSSKLKDMAIYQKIQAFSVDAIAPDLQGSTTSVADPSQLLAGVVFYGDIAAPVDTDIETIKVVIEGKQSGDKLLLDSPSHLLSANITQVDKTVGGISGIDYTFDATSNVLRITKNGGGAFTALQVKSLIQAIQLQNTDASPIAGERTATISCIDGSSNEGTSAIATISVQSVSNGDLATLINNQTTILGDMLTEIRTLVEESAGSGTPDSFVKPGS